MTPPTLDAMQINLSHAEFDDVIDTLMKDNRPIVIDDEGGLRIPADIVLVFLRRPLEEE